MLFALQALIKEAGNSFAWNILVHDLFRVRFFRLFFLRFLSVFVVLLILNLFFHEFFVGFLRFLLFFSDQGWIHGYDFLRYLKFAKNIQIFIIDFLNFWVHSFQVFLDFFRLAYFGDILDFPWNIVGFLPVFFYLLSYLMLGLKNIFFQNIILWRLIDQFLPEYLIVKIYLDIDIFNFYLSIDYCNCIYWLSKES